MHLQDNKVSEGQQQWWQFKAQNFDSVLLFKMGKFYEVRVSPHKGELFLDFVQAQTGFYSPVRCLKWMPMSELTSSG